MKRCVRCVMPDTRPGITFDEQGVCSACRWAEKKNEINWNKRAQELADYLQSLKQRVGDNGYPCAVAVSSGKDSHYQTFLLKEKYGVKPLLLSVRNMVGDYTSAGKHNEDNILARFGCERLSLDLGHAKCKKAFRYGFEKYGSPTWYWDRAVYVYPLKMCAALGIPALFYGENISLEYGGPNAEDTPSAANQVLNGVANDFVEDYKIGSGLGKDDFIWQSLTMEQASAVDVRYLSYYVNWSGVKNRQCAAIHGFKELEYGERRLREGFIEDYDQIDANGYLVHAWMKYPKYGHARVTDVASYWIRDGILSRDRALELVDKFDHLIPAKIVRSFCDFCGYTFDEFERIVYSHTKPAYMSKTQEAMEAVRKTLKQEGDDD